MSTIQTIEQQDIQQQFLLQAQANAPSTTAQLGLSTQSTITSLSPNS